MKALLVKIFNWGNKRRLDPSVIIEKGVDFRGCSFEGNNRISTQSTTINSDIGLGTYIGKQTYLNNSKIGRFCSIGNDIKIIAGKHPTSEFISSHPAFFSTQKQAGFTFVESEKYSERVFINNKSCEIGSDVWIGDNVRIMEGTKIGDGAIIGACSIVTKDVPPFAIVIGNPPQILRYRFEQKLIDKILVNKWWEKELNWIRENSDNLKRFYDQME